ncbi:DUF72 domain-containing protein [Acidovorax sp. NCPPB 3859]|nr:MULTISPECIES: DUF72 domain-containing protein [unclassified Acidovorax]MDA8449107.1 DUF72 domain-containing protein [Acidovorax sp. GBBC 3297]MDA8458805.1 DUF72 domain-containing protein [Acidovorax sp. GBBC 3333]MDA8463863.1 DUF72 domain-containing protein [Acidovorax sp. GBBC 3332]MDA8468895.1 DUF72 domain-containing protein [Acidovorax sp. GBBC 3299]WCM80502.1 DUF72 domain-containing protein [Acidovorax sp. GBBC 712]
MQESLFGDDDLPRPPAPAPAAAQAPAAEEAPAKPRHPPRTGGGVHPIEPDPGLLALAAALPPQLRLGGSSWSYPGWRGLVWEGEHSESTLARQGLAAYARHPLMRTVSIDRGFYKPLTVSQYAGYASQVPDDFRFIVKAPSLVTDALVRAEDGRGRAPNPAFLDPALALQEFVAPALEGLGAKIGALVFQLSPLPLAQLHRLEGTIAQLGALLRAMPPLAPTAPDGVLAVEVRDPEWLSPEYEPLFAEALLSAGATYCLGLHAKMPPLEEQLRLLRRLWPGPLVCRWNLNPVHGAYGYEEAEALYSPFDRIVHPAPEVHALLARTLAGITGKGQNAFVAISNHAEGCAPITIRTLAGQVAALQGYRPQADVDGDSGADRNAGAGAEPESGDNSDNDSTI